MIPLPSIAAIKLAGFAIAIASAFGAGWSVNGWRIHSQTQAADLARAQAATESERENRATESRRSINVIEAQNAQAQRTRTLQAAADRAHAESDGLRSDIAAARAELSSRPPDACADHASASSGLLDTMAAGIERLAQTGAGIAAKADGHASDTLTLQQAWPK